MTRRPVSSADRGAGPYIRRFTPLYQILHVLVIVSFLGLVATGLPLRFAGAPWAAPLMALLGGPVAAGIIHRVFAIVTFGYFFTHLGHVTYRLLREDGARRLLWGPDSMVPRPKDVRDVIQMFKWFVGRGPQPRFDRYSYMEKFDYWAVFWGFAIIGGSGLMLWFPIQTASVLPGWVFNVATLVHGEEAILAAVFLFTVHFFNNHFRPDKFPLDIVMFTGAVSLEEFKREHAAEYKRLLESGELEKHLVDVPSRPMTIGSKALGFTLITIGLILLILVIIGYTGSAGLA